MADWSAFPTAGTAQAPAQADAWAAFPRLRDIDQRGAPADVRAAVGAAQRPEDRLATIQRFYPDARPLGQDNFVFTDPRTGRPTVYNPSGLDWGDAASVLPEVGEFLGGAVGGAGAALFAAPAAAPTGGASFLAVPAGVGLGAAAGRELVTRAAGLLGNTVDRRGLLDRFADAATTTGLNAVGVPLGNAIAQGTRWALGPVQRAFGGRTGQQAIADFANAGVTPSAGDVTGNRTVQLAEATLAASPGGAGRMAAMREAQDAALGEEAERVARSFGTPMEPAAAGRVVREGAEAAADRFKGRQEELYDRAFSLVGDDAPVDPAAVRAVGRRVQTELERAPASRDAVLGPVLARIRNIVADAERPEGLPFNALRAIRTDLRRVLGEPRGAATAPSSDTRVYLEQLYRALTDDMLGVARASGSEADRAIRLADRYTRFHRNVNLPALERVLARETDEQVYNLLFPRSGRPDAQSLDRVLRNLRPEERGALAATVLDRMGMATPGTAGAGDQFSASTFLTNWNRLRQSGDAARTALFGSGPHRQLAQELDRLARVAARIRDTRSMSNWSGTARVAGMGAGAYAAGSEAIEGDWQGVATVGALGVLAPNVAARLITNPAFVHWLAGTTQTVAANPANVRFALPRLAQVAAANPEIREEIEAFRAVFSPANQPRAMPARR